jgi:hypothetical protein
MDRRGRWVSTMSYVPTAPLPTAPLFAGFAMGIGFLAVPALGATVSDEEVPTFADRSDEATDDSTRSLAFMFNPLAMAAGVFGAEADFAFANRLAITLEGDVFDLGGATPAAALGVGLVLYPVRHAFHGLYLEPRVLFAHPVRESPLEVDWRTDAVGLGGTAGWQWTWDYGLSVRLGAGAMEYFGGPASVAPGSSLALRGGDVQLVADASLGWTF